MKLSLIIEFHSKKDLLSEVNFIYLASEYRPVKFISSGFYPGLHTIKKWNEWSYQHRADLVINFPLELNEFEISPFVQV